MVEGKKLAKKGFRNRKQERNKEKSSTTCSKIIMYRQPNQIQLALSSPHKAIRVL